MRVAWLRVQVSLGFLTISTFERFFYGFSHVTKDGNMKTKWKLNIHPSWLTVLRHTWQDAQKSPDGLIRKYEEHEEPRTTWAGWSLELDLPFGNEDRWVRCVMKNGGFPYHRDPSAVRGRGYPDRGWSTMINQVTSRAHWTYQKITPKKSPYLSIFQIIMINYIKIMKIRVPFDRKPSRCKLTTLRKDSCYSCCWSASDAWAFASVSFDGKLVREPRAMKTHLLIGLGLPWGDAVSFWVGNGYGSKPEFTI